jgi:hypothetical protein
MIKGKSSQVTIYKGHDDGSRLAVLALCKPAGLLTVPPLLLHPT